MIAADGDAEKHEPHGVVTTMCQVGGELQDERERKRVKKKSESEGEAPKSKVVPKSNGLGLPGGAEMPWHAVGSS